MRRLAAVELFGEELNNSNISGQLKVYSQTGG
jgi:hypothetical protein